jgi:hypothetical protein
MTTANGSTVDYKDTIRGHVSPIQGVQVLVKSADGLWYLQEDAVVDGETGHWSAQCTFGLPDSYHGFTVLAITGERVQTSPLTDADLSKYVRSRSIGVKRVLPPSDSPAEPTDPLPLTA